MTIYRCKECREAGRDRTWKSLSGYKGHLENFHGAKKTDLVKFAAAPEQEPTNGTGH